MSSYLDPLRRSGSMHSAKSAEEQERPPNTGRFFLTSELHLAPDRSRLPKMSRVYISVSEEERKRIQELAQEWMRSESNTVLVLMRRGLLELTKEGAVKAPAK
jgi:hypothetical protein